MTSNAYFESLIPALWNLLSPFICHLCPVLSANLQCHLQQLDMTSALILPRIIVAKLIRYQLSPIPDKENFITCTADTSEKVAFSYKVKRNRNNPTGPTKTFSIFVLQHAPFDGKDWDSLAVRDNFDCNRRYRNKNWLSETIRGEKITKFSDFRGVALDRRREPDLSFIAFVCLGINQYFPADITDIEVSRKQLFFIG